LELARGNGRDVILQAFHWNLVKTQGTGTLAGRGQSWWSILGSMMDQIAALGVSVLYLPPPWRDDSAWEAGGRHGGGEGYFWHDFDLDSRYGTRGELVELVAAAHARGLKVIADLVLNHRDGTQMKRDVWPYPGPQWARFSHDTGAAFLVGEWDLALDDPTVHARVRAAMNELLDDVGIDGWRWDFVWGYSIEQVITLLRETPKVEYLSMGEYWQGDPFRRDDPLVERYGHDERARILGWARDTRGCAYDVLLKRAIQSADAARLRDGICASSRREEREAVVTYVDNHDTGASPQSNANGWGQRHWECPQGFKTRAYAFILTMPGTPVLYWPDVFDWGLREPLGALVAARRRAGIVAGSEWLDAGAEHGGFAAWICDADGRRALAVAIDSRWPGPGAGFRVAVSEAGAWTVWERETG
jgi:alpha-amylase